MRLVLVAVIAAVVMLAGASVAWADQTHVLILPNGKCAILAAEGNEKYQILPSVSSTTTRTLTPTMRLAASTICP
jgi:hypothetical protein